MDAKAPKAPLAEQIHRVWGYRRILRRCADSARACWGLKNRGHNLALTRYLSNRSCDTIMVPISRSAVNERRFFLQRSTGLLWRLVFCRLDGTSKRCSAKDLLSSDDFIEPYEGGSGDQPHRRSVVWTLNSDEIATEGAIGTSGGEPISSLSLARLALFSFRFFIFIHRPTNLQ